jgi:hypothetical protein
MLDYSIRGSLVHFISPGFYGWTGRGGSSSTDFNTVELRSLILDALELRLAAGIPCCAAGIKVEILHPLHLDVCRQPSALCPLATCWLPVQKGDQEERECRRWLGLGGVASVVCSIGIRVTCEESGDGPADGQDGSGDGSPLQALFFFFFFSFQPLFFG